MSAFNMLVKSRAYFLENWTDTPLQVTEKEFTNNNFEEYIRFEYVVDGSELVSLNCHEEWYSYVKIHCYHKNEILSVKLSELVKTFFDNIDLGDGIRVKDGVQYPTVDMENGYHNTLVMFRVEKL